MRQEQGGTYSKPSTSGPKIPLETPLQKFKKEFDRNHPEFLKNLSLSFQELSHTELLICSGIRSDLPSTEIADMLEITFGTVENHRTHIRTKLGFTSRKQSLYKFLLKF